MMTRCRGDIDAPVPQDETSTGDVTAVSAGWEFTLALRQGRVIMWGDMCPGGFSGGRVVLERASGWVSGIAMYVFNCAKSLGDCVGWKGGRIRVVSRTKTAGYLDALGS
jgi:hypothetical protein